MKETIKDKEAKVTKFWKDNDIFEKSVEKNPKDKQYVFYDGPPFATGTPHYGHILGLTSKDVFPRYFTMKGFRVDRRWGWDCHGLPIESIGEKDLKLNGKDAIEEYGVDKFNEYCRSKVLSYADEWKKTVDMLGKWIEFDNSYKTMDNSYIESVWWAFKELHSKGLIYEGYKVLWFCPKSQTPISNFEIQMDNSYKEVNEPSVYVAFPVKGKNDEYLVAWTTTPWTLMANMALAINTDLDYVKVKKGSKKYILARDLVEEVFPERDGEEEVLPKDILGLEYERFYDLPVEDSSKKGWYVIEGGSEITATEGSGIVHMAPYGEFDYEMIKKHELPFLEHLDSAGKFMLEYKDWKGLYFKKLDKKIIEDLEDRGHLIEARSHSHSYPFSPRYDVPLFQKPLPSWFVNVQKVKALLLEKNAEINWVPEHLKEGRFKNNILSAPDWNISRNRFWASSIPVWKNEDGSVIKIVGSVAELKKLAVDKIPNDLDLHKHAVDKIKIKDPETGLILTRIPEVFDCWFESASMPFASNHYPFENKSEFETNHPADFISEYTGQIRAWFYVMHVMSVALFDKPAYKNVVATGTILAEDGNKMSKSKGNYPDPNLMFEKYGADALRFYLMSSPLMKARDLNFREDGLKEAYRKVVMLVSNVSRFFQMYASNMSLKVPENPSALDRWMLSRLENSKLVVTRAMDAYDTNLACENIKSIVDDLSTWYLRRSRDSIKKGSVESLMTLGYSLHEVAKLIAPITPFISEMVHQDLSKFDDSLAKSIHLEQWSSVNEDLVDETLEIQMVKVRDVVNKALDIREKEGVPIRQVLASLTVEGVEDLDDELKSLIADEVNVKSIKQSSSGKEFKVELDTVITKDLLLEGISRDIIRKLNKHRKDMGLTVKDNVLAEFETDNKDILAALKKHEESIFNAAQIKGVKEGLEMTAVKIKGETLCIGLEKI